MTAKPQLVLDLAGVLVSNFSSTFWLNYLRVPKSRFKTSENNLMRFEKIYGLERSKKMILGMDESANEAN